MAQRSKLLDFTSQLPIIRPILWHRFVRRAYAEDYRTGFRFKENAPIKEAPRIIAEYEAEGLEAVSRTPAYYDIPGRDTIPDYVAILVKRHL